MRERIDRIRAYFEGSPRRVRLWAGGILVLAAALIVLVWYPVKSWRTYVVKPVGVTVELPVAPQQTSTDIEAGMAVYEACNADVAVVIASFEWTCPSESRRESAVRHAMSYLEGRRGMDGLEYRVSQIRFKGRTAWRAVGRFVRGGAQCRLLGLFAGDSESTQQVLCFFSDEQGGRTAERVLKSAQFGAPPPKAVH